MAPPKNKGGSKKPKDEGATSSKKSKGAQSINVRHILVGLHSNYLAGRVAHTAQCAKESRKDEALARIKAGESFDKVARDMSEDKARQGTAAIESLTSWEIILTSCSRRTIRVDDEGELRI